MSNFTQYLTESTKAYDYRIKVAGVLADDFANKLETAMAKWDCQSLSSGKTTPIVELPLDFPHLKNEIVTIFDCSTNYPESVHELREYIADYMRMSPSYVVVRKPGEPTEEYQEEIKDKKDESEFKSKLHDLEYKDAPKVKADEVYGDKANQSLLKELLKDKKKQEFSKTEKTQEAQSKESESTLSPLSKSTNPKPVR